MKLSARNQIKGNVVEVHKGQTTAHVRIDVGNGVVITSSITNEGVEELALKVGDSVLAVIKASDVMVAKIAFSACSSFQIETATKVRSRSYAARKLFAAFSRRSQRIRADVIGGVHVREIWRARMRRIKLGVSNDVPGSKRAASQARQAYKSRQSLLRDGGRISQHLTRSARPPLPSDRNGSDARRGRLHA